MDKQAKKTVELNEAPRPSRIRRDPVRSGKPEGPASRFDLSSSEWEIGLAIVGIVAFALALNVIWIAISAWVRL